MINVMLSINMLSVIMPSVDVLKVVAPFYSLTCYFRFECGHGSRHNDTPHNDTRSRASLWQVSLCLVSMCSLSWRRVIVLHVLLLECSPNCIRPNAAWNKRFCTLGHSISWLLCHPLCKQLSMLVQPSKQNKVSMIDARNGGSTVVNTCHVIPRSRVRAQSVDNVIKHFLA